MIDRWLKHEPLIFLLVVLAAGLVRFVNLGSPPLNDLEAARALQALHIASGQSTLITDAPGYSLLTSVLFFFLVENDAVARFWPAAVGTILCLTPLLYRPMVGRSAALLLALLLAFEPGLVALSRTADGSVLAVTFSIFSLGFYLIHRPVLAGMSLGLAVLGGSTFWAGILPAVMAVGFAWWNSNRRQDEAGPAVGDPTRRGLIFFTGSFLVTFLLAGTLFFLAPEGVSGALNGLGVYLRGWIQPSGLPAVPAIMALLLYHPASWLFGLWQGVRGSIRGNRLDWGLLIFAMAALLQALLMPGRNYGILLWIVLPLAVLAARRLAAPAELAYRDRIWMMVEASLIALLILYAYISFLSGIQNSNPQDAQVYWIAVTGSLALVVITIVLVAWGWSRTVAFTGAALALSIVLYIYQFGAAVQAGGMAQKPAYQLWRSGGVQDADLIVQTLRDLSSLNIGNDREIDVTAAGIDSAALMWSLRDFPQAQFFSVQPVDMNPSVIITPSAGDLALQAEYRGQDFVWASHPDWSAMSMRQWAGWFSTRQAPSVQQMIILWARTDLFPGSQPAVQ